MLPDYPAVKKHIMEMFLQRMKDLGNATNPIYSRMKKLRLFEGKSFTIVREDGTVDKSDMKTISQNLSLNYSEIEDKPIEYILSKIDEYAIAMTDKRAELIYSELDKVTTETGNVVDLKGEELTIDKFLELLEKVWIEFDNEGKPQLPQLYVGTKSGETILNSLKKYENDPTYLNKFDALIQRKKNEWLDRENLRKLVG